MPKETILIIEDEEDILELIEFTLCNAGYETIGLISQKNLENILFEERIDLLIIDRNLPGEDGIEIVTRLRMQGFAQPIIFLTAKDKEEDKITGFNAGADDYITKPFSIKELVARVQVKLKRGHSLMTRFRDIEYNTQSKEILIDGVLIALTYLERKLLLEFMKNIGTVLSRDYLLNTIWKDGYEKQEKTVNVAIKRLNQKIDPLKTKHYIRSIRSEGYILC